MKVRARFRFRFRLWCRVNIRFSVTVRFWPKGLGFELGLELEVGLWLGLDSVR